MKSRWNTSSILGTLLIAAFAYIGSLYVNRYRLVDDGKKRIDTITGRVWVLKTREVFDDSKGSAAVSKARQEYPEIQNLSDKDILETMKEGFEDGTLDSKHVPTRTTYVWEPVSE